MRESGSELEIGDETALRSNGRENKKETKKGDNFTDKHWERERERRRNFTDEEREREQERERERRQNSTEELENERYIGSKR